MASSKFKIQNSKFLKGFTMIELLIVIAVLGVLATAVLSAINPIEQINRGRDTGSRSDAEQLLSAIDRYYTAQEIYPWQAKSDDLDDTRGVAWDGNNVIDDGWVDSDGEKVLEKMSEGGTEEIKKSFVTRISDLADNYKLRIYHDGESNSSAYVCFLARSGSFKEEALNRCANDNGSVGSGLPEDLQGAATQICDEDSPYICLP